MTQEVEILLVEDNQDDLELSLHALKKEKLANRIAVARDGEEALQFVQTRMADGGALPRLILLDLKLPKVDGLEVLRTLKSDVRTAAIPVVMLTASTEEVDLVRSYELGVNSYLRKPVDFSEFRQMVQQIGFYWLVVNQTPNGNPIIAGKRMA